MLADQLLIGAPPEVWTLWNELRIELNVGQFLDILGSVQRERRLDKAERIARYKSGKYTIERPLHVGAVLAAPDAADLLPGLSGYGLPLGDAFQMRDDVIGAFGDSPVTGKPVGDDLREGKPTPLLARAVAPPTPASDACWSASARRTSTTARSPRSSRSSSTPAPSTSWRRTSRARRRSRRRPRPVDSLTRRAASSPRSPPSSSAGCCRCASSSSGPGSAGSPPPPTSSATATTSPSSSAATVPAAAPV